MSTHRYIDAICIVVLLCTLTVTVLFMNGEAFGLQTVIDEDAESFEGFAYFTENDRNGDWKTAGATRISLRGSYAAVTGGGAYAYDGNVMITSAGKYVISGTLDDGAVIVDTNSSAKVWILLDGAQISCSDGAGLNIEQADKVFLTLAADTENRIDSSGVSAENEAVGMDGAIFARDDLTINGSGSLTVNSETVHGITANDELVITGGEISVNAALDGIHVNDGLRLMASTLILKAGDDGISLTGIESELYYESGSVSITASDNGISAENNITVIDGTLMVEAGNDGVSAAGHISLTGGELTITASDDGIHSDASVAISGAAVTILSCYEGIEAVTIEVTDGEITIYPEDDGMNANGGTSGFGFGGFGGFGGGPGGMPFDRRDGGTDRPEPPADGKLSGNEIPESWEPDMMPDGETPEGLELPEMPSLKNLPEENVNTGNRGSGNQIDGQETWIHVSGGSITVINDSARDADGLDSNGDIIITGGVIRVSLTNSGSNSALDYGSESGGVMEISGGEVIACGSYAMAEGFDSTSTQCSILYNLKRGAPAGTTVTLEDSKGNVILQYEVPCSFSSVALSCPEMKLGKTYTVVIGDSSEEITLEEVSASFGDAASEHFGGPMNWGGMKFRP